MYAGEVGVPRLLKLFKKYGITTSWFIPGMYITHMPSHVCPMRCPKGHSLETFPKEMAAVRDAGHEMFVTVRSVARFIDIPCPVDFTDIPMKYAHWHVTSWLDLTFDTTESN